MSKKNKKAKFKPAEYKVEVVDRSGFSEQQIAEAEAAAAADEKRAASLNVLNKIWTLFSTVYVIASTASLLGKHEVHNAVLTIALIVALAVYACAFIGLIAFWASSPQKAENGTKTFKAALKVFKAFVNVMFLVLSAVEMAALAQSGIGFGKWALFSITLAVAILQAAIKAALFFAKINRNVSKRRYRVKVERYVDGKKQKKKLKDKLEERRYK